MLPMALTGITLFFAGLLSGAEATVRFGVKGALETLGEVAHVQARQALIRRLRYLVPAFYFPALASGIAGLFARGLVPGPALAFALTGVIALLAWIAVTLLGTVPLNEAVLEWSAEAPPPDWRAQLTRWERLALIRVLAAALAFAAFLLAAR